MIEWTGPIHDYDSLLHQASYMGHLGMLKELMKDNKIRKTINSKNRLGCTPLRLAATAGHNNCVKYLVEKGAEINICDVKNQTPLFVAIKNKHIKCVRILLMAGANPNGDTQSLCSPIYIAAMDGFVEGVKALMHYGADLNSSRIKLGSFYSTTLYITIAYHREECFKLLLRAGADPDFYCKNPNRPKNANQSLFHAVVRFNCNINYPKLLVDFGSNLWVKDDKEKLACELPQENESKEFIKMAMREPLNLMSQCRIQIRQSLGRKRLKHISDLPLPTRLINFINYSEYF